MQSYFFFKRPIIGGNDAFTETNHDWAQLIPNVGQTIGPFISELICDMSDVN